MIQEIHLHGSQTIDHRYLDAAKTVHIICMISFNHTRVQIIQHFATYVTNIYT